MSEEPHHEEFIIDEGFPVLNNFRYLLSKKDKNPKNEPVENEQDANPIPRFQFASYANALSMPSDSQRTPFINDCSLVFNARTLEDSESYSSGATFFLPCQMKPRCALEALAQRIFRTHTDGLEWEKDDANEVEGNEADSNNNDGDEKKLEKKSKKQLLYDPERSGAEWWTLVLDTPSDEKTNHNDDGDDDDAEDEEDDEVGMHFDADYGLEEQLPNYMLHPRVATVTYLSDTGVPTLILDKKSPPPKDIGKAQLGGDINKGWLSHPSFGKHIAFDGRLLHGAPGEYFPAVAKKGKNSNGNGGAEPQAKKMKVEETSKSNENGDVLCGKRITFMVNVWLNHCPIDAEILDHDIAKKLTTVWQDVDENNASNLKEGDKVTPPFDWNIADVAKPDVLTNTTKIVPAPLISDGPAGDEDVVLCNRHINMSFGATMEDFHAASKLAAEEGSMQIEMGKRVLSLHVGEECSDSEEEAEEN